MNTTDTRILHYLRTNARMNLTTLSRKTGIPVSTIFDRLRRQEGTLITRFTALVDFAQLGLAVRLKLFMKVAPEQRKALKDYLTAHPSVNDLWRINNGWDYTADCAFRDIRESEEFLTKLDESFPIVARQVFHVIDDIAREKMLCEEPILVARSSAHRA